MKKTSKSRRIQNKQWLSTFLDEPERPHRWAEAEAETEGCSYSNKLEKASSRAEFFASSFLMAHVEAIVVMLSDKSFDSLDGIGSYTKHWQVATIRPRSLDMYDYLVSWVEHFKSIILFLANFCMYWLVYNMSKYSFFKIW